MSSAPSACACTPGRDGTAKTVHISFAEFLEGCSPSRGNIGCCDEVASVRVTASGCPLFTCFEVGGPEGAVLRDCS